MFQRLHALFNPEIFQGRGKRTSYFEGWYFKVVNANLSSAYAIIPGIAFDANGDGHAFIQVLDGIKKTAEYHKFPNDSFKADKEVFHVAIGENEFSENHLKVSLPDFKADLIFKHHVPWPKPFYSPGIMGPFSFIPFMECYHGILSMNHKIIGSITTHQKTLSFDNGKGYIEKDWGTSFPSAYVWMQSNHFEEDDISFKCSVAKIPFLGSSFVGFIAGLWMDGELVRFTTYNRCQLKRCSITTSEVIITMEHPNYRLEITAFRDEATPLASPIHGFMDGRIEESMTSNIQLKLTHKTSFTTKILSSHHSCLEVAGHIEQLLK